MVGLKSGALRCGKVYFSVGKSASELRGPKWVYNDRIDSSGWKHLPSEVIHPWECPVKLRGNCVTMLRQTGNGQDLLKGAVQSGVVLTVMQLQSLHAHHRWEMPPKGRGSGKGGALTKLDYVKGLINHCWPDASPEEREGMLANMLGKKAAFLGKTTVHSADIVKAVRALDAADVPTFECMAATALQEVELSSARPDRQPRPGGMSYEAKQFTTPAAQRKDLDSLLPPGPSKLYRHPILKRYQAFYHPHGGSLDRNIIK